MQGCDIVIGDHESPVGLAALDFREFDIILSMDWLTTWHDTFDCFVKRVCFHPPEQSEFCF